MQHEVVRSFAPSAGAEEYEGTPWQTVVKQEYANGFLVCPAGHDLLVFLSRLPMET